MLHSVVCPSVWQCQTTLFFKSDDYNSQLGVLLCQDMHTIQYIHTDLIILYP